MLIAPLKVCRYAELDLQDGCHWHLVLPRPAGELDVGGAIPLSSLTRPAEEPSTAQSASVTGPSYVMLARHMLQVAP